MYTLSKATLIHKVSIAVFFKERKSSEPLPHSTIVDGIITMQGYQCGEQYDTGKTHSQSTGHNENILTVTCEVETLLTVGTVWFLRDRRTQSSSLRELYMANPSRVKEKRL